MNSLFCKFFILILIKTINGAGVFDKCIYSDSKLKPNTGICDLLDNCPKATNATEHCDHSYVCCPRYYLNNEFGFGGVDALRNEFPHMALIGYDSDEKDEESQWRCGGSLITNTFVLSAAHCNAESTPKRVLLGVNDYIRDYKEGEIRSIIEIIDHPEYDFNARTHDICLYRLNEAIAFSKNIKLICLPYLGVDYPSEMVASGWGATSLTSGMSQVLLKMYLNLWDESKCNVPYNTSIQICAGSDQPVDTCSGDSGGPIQVKVTPSLSAPCDFTIIGIVSHGKACLKRNNATSIYSNVSSYLRWIKEIVWYGTMDCELAEII